MTLREQTTYVIELNAVELQRLRDLLLDAAALAQEHGPEWEQLRMDILYAIAQRLEPAP